MNGVVQVCDENVSKRSESNAKIKRSSVFVKSYLDMKEEMEAETRAVEGTITGRVLNWFKREEEDIIAWERKQNDEADKHMKNFE
ncbi:hypothetical protein KI387_003832, partial [Taxus chinensis]